MKICDLPIENGAIGHRKRVLHVSDSYHVHFPDTPYLVLVAIGKYGDSFYRFQHPNMVARFDAVLEFKHYRNNGSKFWTAHPGVELSFVVSTKCIEVLPEQGHSFVPVVIGGEQMTLNVSGGTMNGWTDWVSSQSGVILDRKVKKLKALANAAVSVEEAKQNNVSIHRPPFNDNDRWEKLVAAKVVRPQLKVGDKVVTIGDCSVGHTQLTIRRFFQQKAKQQLIAHDCSEYPFRVGFRYIDWVKTAEVNNIVLPKAVRWDLLTDGRLAI